jgi:hypothetical protein
MTRIEADEVGIRPAKHHARDDGNLAGESCPASLLVRVDSRHSRAVPAQTGLPPKGGAAFMVFL